MNLTPKHSNSSSSYSPTFNSYYNTGLADIAARVTTEFPDSDEFADNGGDTQTPCSEDDFEFDLSNLTPQDGQIRPIYPLFNRDLLAEIHPEEEIKSLFLKDRDQPPSSSSSSEAGDLDEIPPGTYCVLETSDSPSPGRCTKSNSTGSSVSVAAGKAKAWKLTEFLKRSKSDGKEGLIVLKTKKNVPTNFTASSSSSGGDGGKPRRVRAAAAAREGYYGGGENKRRSSYLPYRQDLVGLFATPQAFRKMHLPPF